jgi:SAM-dependent methyltransferase
MDAVGVDSDPLCIAEANKYQVPVIEADVVNFLRNTEPESWDAIVAAHLVEHMPYDTVLELIRLAHRALVPGGRLLLITPNPRALVSHMELYPMHFGHMAMYHPTLLAFFMDFAGFSHTDIGENPLTSTSHVAGRSPLVKLQNVTESAQSLGARLAPEDVLPKPTNPARQVLWWVKTKLMCWLVQPYFDRTSVQLNLSGQLIRTTIEALDRPFECYAIGDKE